MKDTLNLPLRGIIVPLVTPLIDNNTVDKQGLENLIEHTIRGGVHGIFILGTTGEFASLSHKLRMELIELACMLVKDRIPLLVGITDTSLSESLDLAEMANECGADAVVTAPPFYYLLSQKELLNHVKNLKENTQLPLLLYNMPVYTKIAFEPETVRSASEIPGIIGIKDSSSDPGYLMKVRQLLKERNDFTLLTGTEEHLSDFVLSGGHGGIPGGANLFPRLYVELYNASVSRDHEKIIPLQKKVMQICTTIYKSGYHESGYLKGLKCALSVTGLCSGSLAEPLATLSEKEKKSIRTSLNNLNYNELP